MIREWSGCGGRVHPAEHGQIRSALAKPKSPRAGVRADHPALFGLGSEIPT